MAVEGIFSSVDISMSGLKTQGKVMELISSNVANARTTDAGNGEPYRRLEARLQTADDDELISGVSIEDVIKDSSQYKLVFNPGSPAADSNGYVKMPNVDVPIEMMNLAMATRSYQANAATLKRYQKMVETSLELLR